MQWTDDLSGAEQAISALKRYDDGLVKLALSKSGFSDIQQKGIATAIRDLRTQDLILDTEKKRIVAEVLAKGVKEDLLSAEIQNTNALRNHDIKVGESTYTLEAYNRELLKQAILQAAVNKELNEVEVDNIIDGILGKNPKAKLSETTDYLTLAGQSIKKFFKGIGNFAKLHPALSLVGATVAAVGTAYYVAEKRIEAITEAAAETVDKWAELRGEINSNKQTINDIAQEFATLSVGVGKNGENVGLTTDEFGRYNDIANQIADMFPQMIEGYTKMGTAILSCKGSVAELTEETEKQQELYYQTVIKDADSIFKKWNGGWYVNIFDKTKSKLVDSQVQQLEYYRDILEGIYRGDAVDTIENAFQRARASQNANIDVTNFKVGGIKEYTLLANALGEDFAQVFAEAAGGALSEESVHIMRKALEAETLLLENEIAPDLKAMQEVAASYLNLDDIYKDFMPDDQTTIQKFVNSLDAAFFEKNFNKKSDLKEWLEEQLLIPFDTLGPEMREKFRTALDYFVDNGIDLQDLDINLFDEYGEAIDFLKAKLESGEEVDWDALYDDPNNPALKQFIDMLLSIGFIKEPTEEAIHAIARAIAGVELSTIDAIDSISEKHSTAIERLKRNALTVETSPEEVEKYIAALEKAKQAGVDLSKTVYGNVDISNRQALTWTNELIKENKDALTSLGIEAENLVGNVSSAIGGYKEYGNGMQIAFSPVLQTEDGPVLLSQNTVDKYISELVSNMMASGEISSEKLFALDASGLIVDGKKIQGIIADIGAEAEETAAALNYIGSIGYDNAQLVLKFKDVAEAAERAGLSIETFLAINNGFVDWMELYNTNTPVKKFIDEMLLLKGIVEPTADVIREIAEEIAGLQPNANALPEAETYAAIYERAKEEIDLLSNAYEKLAKGEDFSAEEVSKLLDKYPDLVKYYDEETHQLKLTEALLRDKAAASNAAEKASLAASIAATKAAITQNALLLSTAEDRGDDEAAKIHRAALNEAKNLLDELEPQLAYIDSLIDVFYKKIDEIKNTPYTSMYEKVKDDIDLLSNAYEKLAKEQALSVDEVIDLLDKYPDLIEYYNVETGKLELTVELIREKVDATLASEKASLEAAKNTAEGLLKETEAAYAAAASMVTLALTMEQLKGISNDIWGTQDDLSSGRDAANKNNQGTLIVLERRIAQYKQQIEDLTKKLAVLGQIGNSVFELDEAEDEAEKLREKINDWFSDMEFKVELQFNAGKIDVASDMYQQMIDRANQYLSEAYASGMTIDDDWVQELINKLNTYKKGLADLRLDEFDKLIQMNDAFDRWGNDVSSQIAKPTQEAGSKASEAFAEAFDDGLSGYLDSSQFGGNVDLMMRPIVEAADMIAAGWDDFDGDYATTFSQTYSNRDETAAILATPILPNGEVLSPEYLQRYVEDILDGLHGDELGVTIGIFNGSDAIEQADEVGRGVSEAQARWDEFVEEMIAAGEITERTANTLRQLAQSTGMSASSANAAADAFRKYGSKLDTLKKKLSEINKLYTEGLLNYPEWYEAFLDTAGAIYDIQREALDELLDTTMDAIKEDNDAQIEALEEQADAYSKIIDLKKKLLEDTRDEADYEREIAKRTREIAKLQERITQLALDDSREAAAERAALEEELYEKQQELA